jgi:hypothetical protein
MERTKDGATAERLGLEFAEDFRLLQDIGWGEDDDRETFDLDFFPFLVVRHCGQPKPPYADLR